MVHPDQADDRSDRRPTVAVLGDSITFESETELRVALEAGTVVDLTAVVGRPGKTFAELLADAEQIATTGPDLVVINPKDTCARTEMFRLDRVAGLRKAAAHDAAVLAKKAHERHEQAMATPVYIANGDRTS